ncbi:hypothetical protein ACFY1L_50035 [Streptomyces sp. NPDC001663]|uniref:hypothetical protein n=1 Tax=Streptomyces sp. NPDC001663 TaxID=3364597 RepID=UPI0036C7AFDC
MGEGRPPQPRGIPLGYLGGWHATAQRNLVNRMIGQLRHRLQQGGTYDESLAFRTPLTVAVASAV